MRPAATAPSTAVQSRSARASGLLFFPGLIILAALIATAPAAAAGGLVRMEEVGRGSLLLRTVDPRLFLPAPEVETDVEITVSGLVARARVRQRFVNPSDEWLEGVYVFPLPEDAAVDRLRLVLDDRVIEGEIQEREQARTTYEAAREAGQRAGLVEQERPNIFTVAIANLAPGKPITVEIEYQQALVPKGGRFALRFPMVLAPRYVPPVTVAGEERRPTPVAALDGPPSRISPPVALPQILPAADAPDRVHLPVSLLVRLDPGFEIGEMASPYHQVTVRPEMGGTYAVELRDGPVPADRDFVLEWVAEAGAAPQAGLFTETVDGETFLLAMIVPPRLAAEDRPRMPREIVFIIDTSGSMHGPSLEQAKQALTRALTRLNPGDRFNLIAFSDRATALFADAEPATERTLRRALAFVAGLEADGGTELGSALDLALDGADDPTRMRQVVLLTDGAVANESALFDAIKARLGDSRLFTVGIGSAPNSYFMRKAAAHGRGTFTHIGKVSEVAHKMAALFDKLEDPVLTDITLDWRAAAEPEAFPPRLPDLYQGEPVVFTARLSEATEEVAISGRFDGKVWRATMPLTGGRQSPGVAALWARHKVDALLDGLHDGAEPAAVRAAVIETALAHRLVTPYTSLVAVDARPVRPADAAAGRGDVPTNLPDGWSYEHVFGADPAKFGQPGLEPAMLRYLSPAQAGAMGPVVVGAPQTATPAPLLTALAALALLAALLLWRLGRRRAA